MSKRVLALIGILALLLLPLASLGAAPGSGDPPGLDRALAAQSKHTESLMRNPGVVGTAVGLSPSGQAAVLVLTKGPGVGGIPANLDGVAVVALVTGEILAKDPMGKGGGQGGSGKVTTPSTTSRWPRPVPIGISTGNTGQCSAGTIGARVRDAGGNVYALSNNHVYALENTAAIGSDVLQPGRYDTGCAYDANDVIGNLSNFVPIEFSTSASNVVDAAIAVTSTANLGNATPSGGYGMPASATVAAQLNQAVQKYGRTTKLTKGSVVGINATVDVGYSYGTARFVDQIIIRGNKPFSKAGDSGSLIVTTTGKNPVGLLFAGSSNGYTIANPIDAVLGAFGVSVDGQ